MIDITPFTKALDGKPVAVFGLGLSNMAVVRALERAGAEVAAGDDDPDKNQCDLLKEEMGRFACLVLAPGIGPAHPVAQRARAAGIEIICDIEILHRCGHGRRVIGVTGTNGKSTTTALIGHILNACGVPASVGGNIGRAALDLDMPSENGAFVLELSSYQLELCPAFTPDIGVLLNVTPDHLERHGTMDAYAAAKERIFRGDGKAVVAVDDDISRRIFAETRREKCAVSMNDATVQGLDIQMLPGAHNRQNMAAALAACRAMGLAEADILRAMRDYPGLPHRQYPVRTLNGVTYINDSKATNADAAGKALACYDDIFWIAGGRQKSGGLKGLEPFLPRVRHAFLIGEAEADFTSWMKRNGVKCTRCGTLSRAVAAAREAAEDRGGGIVLLSPACSSFDQFRNFEERGDAFAGIVTGFGAEPTGMERKL